MCVALSVLRFFSITSPRGSYEMLPTSLHRSVCVRFDSMFNRVLCNLQRMITAWLGGAAVAPGVPIPLPQSWQRTWCGV